MAGEQGSIKIENAPLQGWEAEARRGQEEQMPPAACMWLSEQSWQLPKCLCQSRWHIFKAVLAAPAGTPGTLVLQKPTNLETLFCLSAFH